MNRPLLLFFIALAFIMAMTSCRNKQVKPVVKAPIPEVLHPSEKAAQDALTLELTEFVKDGCFSQASLGYIILDFTKGMPKLIAEHNSKQGLIPASTQKILTTGAALEIFGPPVYHEVTITNLNSINWRANRLLQKIGEKKYNKYDFIHGSRAVMEYWRDKGVDMKGMYICDGSGKSRDNTLSVKLLSDILFKMTTSPVFPVFYNSLPIAGLTGTMHKWLKGSDGQGRVHAKTGSLAGVRSYTGYVRTLTGKKLIFAFIVNNYSCRTPVFKKKMERVMVKMAEL